MTKTRGEHRVKKKPNAGKLLSVALVLTLAAGGCGTTTQKEPPGSSAGEPVTDTADEEVKDKNECADGHVFGGWTVDTEATENSEGLEKQVCSRCGAENTRSIPVKNKGAQEYKLVWEDEFEGDQLNTDDWNYEYHEPGWVNAELQEYVDQRKTLM